MKLIINKTKNMNIQDLPKYHLGQEFYMIHNLGDVKITKHYITLLSIHYSKEYIEAGLKTGLNDVGVTPIKIFIKDGRIEIPENHIPIYDKIEDAEKALQLKLKEDFERLEQQEKNIAERKLKLKSLIH